MATLYSSHSNRGMDFEHLINLTNEMYINKRMACVVKIPTEFIPLRHNGAICTVKVGKKSYCDYIGEVGGVPVAIEAKSTKTGRIKYDAVKEHQGLFLNDWEANGGLSYILVSFSFEKYYLVPWDYWKQCISNAHKGKKDFSFRKKKYHLTGKASVTIDEIPAEWTVTPGNGVPIDYAAQIRKDIEELRQKGVQEA